MMMMMIQ